MKTTGMLTLLVMLCAGIAGAQPPVGHWTLDDGQGLSARDASGNGHDGALMNDARGASWVTGRNGGAVEFSGGDPQQRNQAGCMQIPGLGGLDWSKGLTVSLWLRFNELTRPATYEIVSNTEDDRGKGFRLMCSWLSIGLRSGEGGAGTTWGASSDPTRFVPVVGEWYHIAATYDSGVFRVYVDGELQGQSEGELALTPGLPTVYVGAYHGGYAYGLNGVVDDLRIYDYARTSAQIVEDAKLAD